MAWAAMYAGALSMQWRDILPLFLWFSDLERCVTQGTCVHMCTRKRNDFGQ